MAVPVRAQRVASDSVRFYRLQAREFADSSYTSALRRARAELKLRLDSLQRDFDYMSLESPDRMPRLREIKALLSSLTNLSELEDAARARSAEGNARAARQKVLMLDRSEDLATPLQFSDAMRLPGWIGIVVQAPHQQMVHGDTAYIRYFSYPEILSVEPESPAERAGISSGDRLIAYNGDDVRDREINLTRLLQPARRITVTVRRDGEDRDFPVVVSRAPMRFVRRRSLPVPDQPLRATVAPGAPGFIVLPPRAPMALRAPVAVRVFSNDGSVPIAGASLSEIRDQELGSIFGVASGLLVTEVFSDPAQSSGLKGGDVIVAADGQEVTRLAQLQQIISAHNDDRAVELEIVRQKRTRTVTLRW